jgi:hypothetical protein
MASDFLFNVQYGIDHVLDINGYDHVLFLILLTVAYSFESWKQLFMLVTAFTLGHTVALLLVAYGVLNIDDALVEFLIPVTIALAAIYNIIDGGKSIKSKGASWLFLITLCFGVVHGLGFGREFKLFIGKSDDKLLPLLEFALGIEIAQLIIVFLVLLLGLVAQVIFKRNRRDWILVVSAAVLGLVIPILKANIFW